MKKLLKRGLMGWGIAAILWSSCHENPYKIGERYYMNLCANCHMEDGTGLELLIPPLAGADFVRNHPERLPCIIRHGMTGKVVVNGVEYEQEMPGTKDLTDFEITNLLNFINKAWGNDYPVVQYELVRKALENCEPQLTIDN